MTDPNNSNPTTNPQDIIDQALTGVATPPTLPTPEPLTPATPSVPAPDNTTPPTTPQPSTDMPTQSSEETVPTELTQPMETASSAPVTPDLPPEPPKASAVGDDMPLAFAGATVEATAPTASAPVVEPVAPFVPPALTSSPSDNGAMLKKKSKVSKVLMVIVGFFMFTGLMGGVGYYYYSTYGTIEPATIAKISDLSKEQCNGCSCNTPGCGGGWLVWRDGSCKVSGICNSKPVNSNNPSKDTVDPNNQNIDQLGKTACQGTSGLQWCESIDSTGKPYAFCMKNDGSQGSCNTRAVEKGYTITYGASWRQSAEGQFKYYCNCGGSAYYFDKPGVCDNSSVTREGGPKGTLNPNFKHDGAGRPLGQGSSGGAGDYDLWGLCKIVTEKNSVDQKSIGDYNDCFTCTNKGCSITNDPGKSHCNVCAVVKYTCGASTDLSGTFCGYNNNEDENSGPVKAQNSSGKCGTVEQIDVMCEDVGYVQSRTIINPPCEEGEEVVNSPSPSPSTSSSLMCVGISKTPNKTPAVGDTFTFTCEGASVPAGSINLSYKFRYSLNSGSYVTMSNATATTADLTIAACGTYKVQCQACGTINGATVCDPDWAAAVQQ